MSLVLVADDEPAVLEVLTEVVEDLGHQVVRAHDGREALHLARTQRPNLVVTDHMMPRLSGLDLCRAIQDDETLRGTPVILLSAALPPEAQEAYAYLSKPFELDDFEALVKRTLDALQANVTPAVDVGVGPARPASLRPRDARIAWVAHELKTPMAAAKMSLQLLERRVLHQQQKPESAHFAAVARQLDSMEQIVNALVDATRLAEGRLQLSISPGDLRTCVQAAIAGWRERHNEVAFDLDVPSEPVTLPFDAARITQVLNLLLSNAVKHGSPPRHVRIQLARRASTAEIKVQDFGPGIPLAAQKNLLRGAGEAEGDDGGAEGIGLTLASGIARLHQGTLSVNSSPGEGATFTLSLPLST